MDTKRLDPGGVRSHYTRYILWVFTVVTLVGGGGGVTAPSIILYYIHIVFSLLLHVYNKFTMSGFDDA